MTDATDDSTTAGSKKRIIIALGATLLVATGIVAIALTRSHHGGPAATSPTANGAPGVSATSVQPPGKKRSGGKGSTTTSGGSGTNHLHVEQNPSPPTGCLASPQSCGYPDASNTGVPARVQLAPSGPVDITTEGSLISGLDVQGGVVVSANNVVIQNSRITCSGGCRFAIRVPSGVTGLSIHDVETACDTGCGAGIGGGGSFMVERGNIHGGIDGLHPETGSVIRDTYVHDLTPTDTSHNDTIQQINKAGGSNITIVHNTLFPYSFVTHVFNNSALIYGNVTNLVFTDNLIDGGSTSVQCSGHNLAGNVFARNRFGHDYRFKPVAANCLHSPGVEWDRTNVYFDSGQPVTAALKS